MTLVRERRHQQALTLSLPPLLPAADFSHRTYPPALFSTVSPDSPVIDNLLDLEKLAVLGHGNGGMVYKVRHKRTASIFALKVIRFDLGMIRFQAAREAEILKRVDSPHVVRCHAVFKSEEYDLCFVMEHMEGGSLHETLITCKRLPEHAISSLTGSVLRGLHYLHSMQIVHGDIKPSNLLINATGQIKIADFGVSRFVMSKDATSGSESHMGTCAYMSPERLDPERWSGGGNSDGFAGDIWSLGIVVLECLVGDYPLIRSGERGDWAALVWAICYGERVEMPENTSPELRSFVRRCLERDWSKRGTVIELLHHPFVCKTNSSCGSLLQGLC